jgi:hypothetical protein
MVPRNVRRFIIGSMQRPSSGSLGVYHSVLTHPRIPEAWQQVRRNIQWLLSEKGWFRRGVVQLSAHSHRCLNQQPRSKVSSNKLVINEDMTGDHQGPGVPDVRPDVMKASVVIKVASKGCGD